MSAPLVLNVLGALLVVIAVVLLVARAFAAGSRRRRGADPLAQIHVLSRASLAPKQGVAVVEVGERRMMVSYGDGGVRLVSHVGSAEIVSPNPLDQELQVRPVKSIDLAGRLRRSSKSVVLSTVLMVATANGLAAQTPAVPAVVPPAAAVGAEATATTPTAAQVATPLDPTAQDQLPAETAATEALGPGVLWDLMQAAGLNNGDNEDRLLPGPVGAVLFVGFLTLLPTLLLLMTSFTRILVVLNLLRQAVGTQTAPPSHLLIALALLLTGFVMSPTLQEVNTVALSPWVDGEIDEVQMLQAAADPFRDFMLSQVRDQDLAMFAEMQQARPAQMDDVPLPVITSAFVTSELRRAFQIGFALFLPFVVIDVVVASVLMSMGMFMLPPVMVSLPFKLLLFVLVDGWALLLGGLVRSFAV